MENTSSDNSKKQYKYPRKQVHCDVCNCDVSCSSYYKYTHLKSPKHLENVKKQEERIQTIPIIDTIPTINTESIVEIIQSMYGSFQLQINTLTQTFNLNTQKLTDEINELKNEIQILNSLTKTKIYKIKKEKTLKTKHIKK